MSEEALLVVAKMNGGDVAIALKEVVALRGQVDKNELAVSKLSRTINELKAEAIPRGVGTEKSLGEQIFDLVTRGEDQAALNLMEPSDGFHDWSRNGSIEFEDVGGVTALHRAARTGHRFLCRRILECWPDAANRLTWPTRSPGKWTVMHFIADAEAKNLCRHADVAGVTELVWNRMDKSLIRKQNTTGNTAFHLAAGRGTTTALTWLETIFPLMEDEFDREHIREILQIANDNGESCMDNAIYNRKVGPHFSKYGAICLRTKPSNWGRAQEEHLRENKRRAARDWQPSVSKRYHLGDHSVGR